jgi:hypothetical protein
MIIYGTSEAKQVITKKMIGEKCPKCHELNSLESTIYTGYNHVYGIPLGPIGKKAIFFCSSCQATIEEYKAPRSLRKKVEKEKEKLKTPIWYFSGIFIFVLFVAFIIYLDFADKANTKKYVAAPAVNDVYEFKNDVGHYTLFKIDEVFEDSVVIFFNSYESTSSSKLYELDDSIKYDYETFYILAKSTLLEMYEEKKILKINRE